MQVAGHLQKVAVCIYEKSLIPPLVEMTGSPVSFVEVDGIGDAEVAHEFLKVCARGFDDEMKMVGHKDEGEQMDLIDFKGAGKKVEKLLSVVVSEKNMLPSVAPAGDVVAGVFILDT